MLWAKLLAAPAIFKVALAGVLIAGVMGAAWGWQIKGKNNTIRSLTTERNDAIASGAACEVSKSQMEAAITKQNAEVKALKLKAERAQSAAAAAALRALQLGEATADDLRKPTSTVPPGDGAMNAWLKERFGGTQ